MYTMYDEPTIDTKKQAVRTPEAPKKRAPCFNHDDRAYSEGTRRRKKIVLRCSRCGRYA